MKKSIVSNKISFLFLNWICPIILVFMVLNTFFNIIPEIRTIDTKSICILDSSRVYSDIQQNKTETLISTLNDWMSIDGNQISTREDIKMQIRLFYLTILVGLVSLYHNRSSEKNISPIFFVMILFFYGLEVNFNDMSKRYTDSYNVKGDAVKFLINLSPDDKSLYKLNSTNFERAWNRAIAESKERKFLSALKPNIEQIVIFIFPFSFFLILHILKKSKQ